jgi:hypothetical protein
MVACGGEEKRVAQPRTALPVWREMKIYFFIIFI